MNIREVLLLVAVVIGGIYHFGKRKLVLRTYGPDACWKPGPRSMRLGGSPRSTIRDTARTFARSPWAMRYTRCQLLPVAPIRSAPLHKPAVHRNRLCHSVRVLHVSQRCARSAGSLGVHFVPDVFELLQC
jgi:hypothetical protein